MREVGQSGGKCWAVINTSESCQRLRACNDLCRDLALRQWSQASTNPPSPGERVSLYEVASLTEDKS